MKNKFTNLLFNILIQEVVKKHVNDALECIGIKSKINFLLYSEETHELNVTELLENFHTTTELIMEAKKKIRRQEQKIKLKRDSGICDKCLPSKKVKQCHHEVNI